MKKILSLILVVFLVACLMVSCGNSGNNNGGNNGGNNDGGNNDGGNNDGGNNDGGNTGNQVDPNAKSEGTMTYAEYIAAELNSEVVIEGFVQGKQSWWENKASIYLQDGTGGYFAYNMTCTEEEYNQLTVGTKIKVKGYKIEWKGLVEVDEGATFEIVGEDKWVAEPTDVTSLLGTDELVEKQNMLVSFKDMTVVSISFKADGDDIYVALSKDGAEYEFCVEKYLTGPETDLYKAVSALKAGDVVDLDGFLYWWEGPNTHITGVTVK